MASRTSKRTGTPSTNVGGEIRRLEKLHKYAFRPYHGRSDITQYLEGVLQLSWTAKGKKARTAFRKKIRSVSKVEARKGKGTIHTIIEASAGATPLRMRNRWVQALLYAHKKRSQVERDGLAKFFKANAGVAGCAAKMAKLRKEQNAQSKLKISPQAKIRLHG